ncbi:hypothetical protein E4U35_003756 [Claviceps purpurea]|nr:hypothetical protein E4U35_003756 [Claviceps purpurea]
MKTTIFLFSLLSIGASALPEPEEVVIFDGKHTYRGGDVKLTKDMDTSLEALQNLQRQCKCNGCWSRGIQCNPHQCECVGSAGCWACDDGKYYCQDGPYSGDCPN